MYFNTKTDLICPAPSCLAGMAALNGSLGSGGLSNGSGSTMEALSQAYSGIQQYAAAAALPNLYNQSLLSQQSISAAGSQKEGQWGLVPSRDGVDTPQYQ